MTDTTTLSKPDQLVLTRQVFGDERIAVLKEQIAPGASDAELELFSAVVRRTRLDPFARQIWSIQRRRKTRDGNWEAYQVIQIGVHGLRLVAQRSGQYGPQDGPYWCGEDGKWTNVWLSKEPPAAARVGVKRKDWTQTLYSVAVWDRAVQRDAAGKPMARWATNGPEMLALAAERDALRRAFPMETADIEAVVDDTERETTERNAQRYDEIFPDEAELDQDAMAHSSQPLL